MKHAGVIVPDGANARFVVPAHPSTVSYLLIDGNQYAMRFLYCSYCLLFHDDAGYQEIPTDD